MYTLHELLMTHAYTHEELLRALAYTPEELHTPEFHVT